MTVDLAAGIVQAERAISSYYLIGYYPSNSALDGTFRHVQIKLKDTPAAKLYFRLGYFAPKTFNRFTALDKERQLEDALIRRTSLEVGNAEVARRVPWVRGVIHAVA